METGVVASNYAGTSEGGGICATTDKSSYISSGYLTNNVTDTDFDYGGGGLFLPSATHGKETGVTVRYPLVTGNTPRLRRRRGCVHQRRGGHFRCGYLRQHGPAEKCHD